MLLSVFKATSFAAALASAALLANCDAANASTIRGGFDGSTLAANDDLSTDLVDLGFTANFFGVSRTQAYVNNNGNITFDDALAQFTPFSLTATERQIIAPFFADIDTRGADSLQLTYGKGSVDGRAAFGVNWLNVGYFNTKSDKLNSIQLVLTDRSDTGDGNFDIEFNYDDIVWETGSMSDGIDGFGGSSARAGFSNGTGQAGSFFEIAGSAVNGAFLNDGTNALKFGSNIDVAGRFLFTARNGTVIITPPPMAAVPVPASLPLLALGMGGFAMMRRRRKMT